MTVAPGPADGARIAVISEAFLRSRVTRAMALEAVSLGLVASAEGRYENFVSVRGHGGGPDRIVNVKSGVDHEAGLVCLKAGTFWVANAQKGLPNHGSAILVLDPDTGFPQAVIEAAWLNGLRTAAADALAVQHLARRDASALSLIGAGNQAVHDALAISQVRTLSTVRVVSRQPSRAASAVERLIGEGLSAKAVPLEDAVREADIIVTATPSREPLFPADWVQPGTHISAMGADAVGKQELDPLLFGKARTFTDDVTQSGRIGELQHPLKAGVLSEGAVTAIGHVIAGNATARHSDQDITLFDSCGIAAQDVAIAKAVLSLAAGEE